MANDRNLIVMPSPHVLDNSSTKNIMRDVIIALMPAFVVAVLVFGYRAFVLTALCVVACVGFEYACNKMFKRKKSIGDLSAVVTGILVAYNLPVSLPYWMAVVGCFVAIVIVKQIFGGLGQNFVNPAITARVVLFISFATPMTHWDIPTERGIFPDTVTGATPLGLYAKEKFAEIPSNMDLFLGTIGGSLGEVSALALLIGGAYLIARKVITPTIPVAYIATVAVFAMIIGEDPLFHVLAGGVMLGAIFMATDYVTSPITEKGRLIFGIACGIITMLIRVYGAYPEGVSFAILFMNIVVPHINNLTRTKPKGAVGGAVK